MNWYRTWLKLVWLDTTQQYVLSSKHGLKLVCMDTTQQFVLSSKHGVKKKGKWEGRTLTSTWWSWWLTTRASMSSHKHSFEASHTWKTDLIIGLPWLSLIQMFPWHISSLGVWVSSICSHGGSWSLSGSWAFNYLDPPSMVFLAHLCLSGEHTHESYIYISVI